MESFNTRFISSAFRCYQIYILLHRSISALISVHKCSEDVVSFCIYRKLIYYPYQLIVKKAVIVEIVEADLKSSAQCCSQTNNETIIMLLFAFVALMARTGHLWSF